MRVVAERGGNNNNNGEGSKCACVFERSIEQV
jgi:hypothetical protein